MCEQCGGASWVLDGTDAAGSDYYRPCSSCRPELYELWRGGHLAPDHVCAACAPSRMKPSPKARAPRQHGEKSVPNEEPPPPPVPATQEMF